mmetsp:Transcript_94625/g.276611  ORF Transcript_94625/g.276611 Transcript_94625/m.276611 type:complete len:217 (-) Transcript_94625:2094-2744(-)
MLLPALSAAQQLAPVCPGHVEGPVTSGPVCDHGAALGQLLAQDHGAEPGNKLALEVALEWPSTELWIVRLGQRMVHGGIRELQCDAQLIEAPHHVGQEQPHDLSEGAARERAEDNDVVQTVQQLWAQRPADGRQRPVLGCLDLSRTGPGRHGLQGVLCPKVGRHYHHAVAAVHGAALRVRDTAIIEQLQQNVQDVGVRLLHLVEEQDVVGAPSDRL